jgi:predicted N-acetyltransferase YhbS
VVLPDRQNAGIGSKLIREGLKQLKLSGARGCVVLGDPAYYQRFGFMPHPGLNYTDVPPEYFQALSFVGDLPTGSVAYHDGFNAK